MNSESSQRLGFDLHALDVLLDSFARAAADPQTDRSEFYGSMNQKVVACTESRASAIFLKNQEGQVRIVNQSGWNELDTATGEELKTAIKQVFREPLDAESIRGGLPDCIPRTLTNASIFIASCVPRNGLQFVYVLTRAKQDNDFAGQVFGDLAKEIAGLIEAFENRRAADQKPQSLLELTQIAQLVQNLGKSNNVAEMSFHLVNDLARITKADRVSFVGAAGKIQAVSGVSRVSFRTSVARVLSKIARLAMASNGSIEWSEGQINVDGNRTPRGLNQLIAELPSISGFAIPLQASGRAHGVLLLEYFGESLQALERRELVNEAVRFATPVIARCLQVYSIPAIGTLDLLFNRFLVKPVRVLGTLVLILGAAAVCLFLLFGVQRTFEIYGEGILQTAEERSVFAQIDGEVDEILVQEGSYVEKDQQLLVVRSESLNKELIAIEGEIEEAKQELRNLMLSDFRLSAADEAAPDNETKTASDIERLKIRLQTLNARLAFFEDKKSQLEINSPIAGQVTTPNLRQRLTDRPINRGDLMMTVSDTNGQWEIELKIPDNRIEFIKAAQAADPNRPLTVVFRLASDAEKTFTGELSRLDYRSDKRSPTEESMVLAYVAIDETELGESLRLGTRVYGKINCGERNNFFLLTYEARHKIQEWLFH